MSLISKYNLQEFNLLVNQGEIEGHSVIDKFGELPDISTGTADIWEGGDASLKGTGIYTFSSTANIDSISSSDAGDNTQIIKAQGLAGDGTGLTGYAKLNGQTTVNFVSNSDGLTGSSVAFWRLHRMENEADAGGDLSGVVYAYINGAAVTLGVPDVDADVRAIINNGNNQTLMAIYTVPKGKVGFLYRGEAGISRGGGVSAAASLSYRSRRFGKVFKIKKKIAINTQGTSTYLDKRSFPDVVPAFTDIVLRVDEVSAAVGIFGTFDFLLVDEDKLSSDFLTLISQPE